MKKIYAMLAVLFLVLALAVPVMATPADPTSTSTVSGDVNQATGASTDSSWFTTSSGAAGGSENSVASFSATITEPDGESAKGNASVLGGITVISNSDSKGSNSAAFGFTMGNSGQENGQYVQVYPNNLTDGYKVKISGDGSLSLGTQALTGDINSTQVWNQSLNSFDTVLNIGPNGGALATSGANGSYHYDAMSTKDYTGWAGSGSVVGFSFSSAKTIPGGFSALAGASVTSIACPGVK
jgi:hypothetical protein